MKRTRYLGKAFASLFFDDSCMICDNELRLTESQVCRTCMRTLTLLTDNRCPRCAYPYPPFTHTHHCPHCFGKTLPYTETHALFSMNEPLKSIIHSAKYHSHHWLFSVFTQHLLTHTRPVLLRKHIDLIVPVPLSWYRSYTRGFNQADIIAQLIAPMITVSVVRALTRFHTPQQSMLSRKERLTNLKQAFKIRNSQVVQNKRILLVDDVYTTGSTVGECARVLKKSGAHSVIVFTLARAI